MSHVGLIMELIEASIHQILYTRKIYPEIMFEKRQKYSMEVWRCKNSDVVSYIERVMTNTAPLLKVGAVDEVVMSVIDASGAPVDHIAFHLGSFPVDMSGQDLQGGNSVSREDLDVLEKQLQSLLLLLSLQNGLLNHFDSTYTWELCLLTGKHNEAVTDAVKEASSSGQWIADFERKLRDGDEDYGLRDARSQLLFRSQDSPTHSELRGTHGGESDGGQPRTVAQVRQLYSVECAFFTCRVDAYTFPNSLKGNQERPSL